MISICCPTRGRPDNIRRLHQSATDLAFGEVELVLYIDDDDRASLEVAEELPYVVTVVGPRIVLSDMWNACTEEASADVLMQCGDDIVFRSYGWDQMVTGVIERSPDGILLVHGNDLVHGRRLATHPFLTRRWVDTVGYLVPPGFSCDWTDAWLHDVASAIDRRFYIPGLITEHMHPVVGKARLDDTHRERIARGRRDDVARLYAERAPERLADIAKLRTAMEESHV